MRFSRDSSGTDDQGGPEMAPMVDVCFLMLIFFMVASVFAQFERNVDLVVPKASTGEQLERFPGEIIVNVSKDGSLMINNVKRTFSELDAILADVAQYYTGQPIVIRADKDSAHQYFVKVYDLCRKHRIENIRIATMQEEQ